MIKKLQAIIVVVLLTASVFAQAPQTISYQAVIRNSSGDLVPLSQIGIQISIIKGSDPDEGTVVYTETQIPATNKNGLISIEIGAEENSDDDFSAIDWADGPYFIKTEIDPTEAGGTDYTIIGTSQLLSVPYALHAKTAESYTNSQAANITSLDITNLSNLSGTNTGDQDISGITTNASNITTLKTGQTTQDAAIALNTAKTGITAAQAIAINNNTAKVGVTEYAIGDFAQGGIVFWVDETGQHGLACAIEDQDGGSGIQWYNGSYTTTSAVGDGVYAGEMNTLLIIANQGATLTDYAAGVCVNYSVTQNSVTYGDWYLPSKYELNLMYINKATINATATANSGSSFASAYYWSSSEYLNGSAWVQSFGSGGQGYGGKGGAYYVRAVRAF
jgi:hypothetical protein